MLVWVSCVMSAIAQESTVNHIHFSNQYTLNFRVNEASLDHTYMDNGSTIEALIKDLGELNSKADTKMDSLLIVASASPEGPAALNKRLSIQRAENIKSILLNINPELNPEIIKIESCPADWDAVLKVVEEDTSIPHRDTLLAVLTNPDIEHNDASLRSMPLIWKYIRTSVLGELRTAVITIYLINAEVIPVPQDPQPQQQPEPLPEPIQEVTSMPEYIPEPVIEIKRRKMIMAARTNLLVPGMNVGLEFPIKDNWSIGLDYYFPWALSKNNDWCLETLGGFIEARYWFPGSKYKWTDAERLQGHSIGVYGGVGYYDYQMKADGLQGEYIDVGVDYTFALPVAKGKLRMEFNLGVGFIRSWYRPYYMSSDYADLIKEPGILYNTTNFFGPTRAGISLVVPIVAKSKSTRKGGE